MKWILITQAILISTLVHGQTKDLLGKVKAVEGDFWYKLNDSLEFKGTQWVCTEPVTTIFTKITLNTVTSIVTVEGYFLFMGEPVDTAALGVSGAYIFLLNVSENGEIKRVFDLGETTDEYRSATHQLYPGHFSRMFTLANNDILLIGFPGITGATAFYIGELLTPKINCAIE